MRIQYLNTRFLLVLGLYHSKSTNLLKFSGWHKLISFCVAQIITVIEEDISSIYLRAFLKTGIVWETMVWKVPECCCMWSNLLFQLILHKNSEPSFTSSVVMWTASLPLRNTLVTGVSPIFQKVTKNLNTWWKLNEKKFSKLMSKNS